jgi:HSP20 family protein
MWTMWNDLGRELDRVFRELGVQAGSAAGWPRANLWDRGNELVLQAEVPGLSQKELTLTATQESLTIGGERKSDAPQGYAVHRQERAPYRFERSFVLPCRIDVEKVAATVKHGILTVTMAKAIEAQPRQITVKAQ